MILQEALELCPATSGSNFECSHFNSIMLGIGQSCDLLSPCPACTRRISHLHALGFLSSAVTKPEKSQQSWVRDSHGPQETLKFSMGSSHMVAYDSAIWNPYHCNCKPLQSNCLFSVPSARWRTLLSLSLHFLRSLLEKPGVLMAWDRCLTKQLSLQHRMGKGVVWGWNGKFRK